MIWVVTCIVLNRLRCVLDAMLCAAQGSSYVLYTCRFCCNARSHQCTILYCAAVWIFVDWLHASSLLVCLVGIYITWQDSTSLFVEHTLAENILSWYMCAHRTIIIPTIISSGLIICWILIKLGRWSGQQYYFVCLHGSKPITCAGAIA